MTVRRSRHEGPAGLNASAFEQLLQRLDPRRDAAAISYERLHQKLTTFFDWRGVRDPERAADDTLDRVARRLEQGESIAHLPAYVHGVARLMLKEVRRSEQRVTPAHWLDNQEQVSAAAEDSDDAYERCLESCLDRLSSRNRELILEYYSASSGRARHHKAQAERLGLTSAALRVTAYRIRIDLEQCVERCVAHGLE
jgi:DNA-directed RNA polymerase specialized sigma24 family protein